MTVKNECEDIMAEIDSYIRSNGSSTRGTSPAETVAQAPGQYPSTRAGLAAFAKSHAMRELLHADPDEFRRRYLTFVLDRELVKRNECTATEVGMWSHRLSMLPGIGNRPPLGKSVEHMDAMPEPWNFQLNPRGLEGFLHSPAMLELKQANPALWRRQHLDFYSSMEPKPLPHDMSMKRQQLEAECPDLGTTVAKAMTPGARLTTGQHILISNFGRSIGDPSQWLRPR